MAKSPQEKIWINIPLIPKCVKVHILLFIIFMSILIFDTHCIFSFSFMILWFLSILFMLYKRKQRIKSTYTWKKIRASVISKSIEKGSPFGVTPLLPYVINIAYRYTYGKHTYQANTFGIASCMEPYMNYIFSQDEANDLLKERIKDNHIDIYINPHNPSDSIIMQGMSTTHSSSYFSPLIAFIIPSLFFYIKCIL